MRHIIPLCAFSLLTACDLATPTDPSVTPPSDSTQAATGVHWRRWSLCVDGTAFATQCPACGENVWSWYATILPTRRDTVEVHNDSGAVCAAIPAMPDTLRLTLDDVARNGNLREIYLEDTTGREYRIEIGDSFRMHPDSLVALETSK